MSSLDAYCQKLKELADQLSDVDNPVIEQRLVLQLVRGLPPEFDTAASFINQSIPTWDTACSMLQLEQHRQSARANIDPPPTIIAAASHEPPLPAPDHRRDPPNRGTYRPPNRRQSSNNRGRNNRGHYGLPGNPYGNPTRSPWPNSSPPPWAAPSPWSTQYGYWNIPSCPHPNQPTTPAPWTPRPNNNHRPQPSPPPAAHANLAEYDALDPTDLGNAFQVMALDYHNPDD